MKRYICLIFILVSVLSAGKPIIKVEAQELLRALAYTESAPYVQIYEWDIVSNGISPIEWDVMGNNWTPDGFERNGKIYLSNKGTITHSIVDSDKKPGFWKIYMLGNKDKIITVKLSPNAATLENPNINIDEAYIKEEIICSENDTSKKTAYLVNFPKKIPFWLLEDKTISPKGGKSEYVLLYDSKPECVKNAIAKQQKIVKKIPEDIKASIKSSLITFNKANKSQYPAKLLSYYADNIKEFFGQKDITKSDFLDCHVKFYEKFPQRSYELQDFEIIETSVDSGIRRYLVATVVDWNITSENNKSIEGRSHNMLTFVEVDDKLLIEGIGQIGTKKINGLNCSSFVKYGSIKNNKHKVETPVKVVEPKNIKSFLNDFVKSGESRSAYDALRFYADTVVPYFSIKRADHNDILQDKISYYQRWPIRSYSMLSYNILDTYECGDQTCIDVEIKIDWSVSGRKGNREGNSVVSATLRTHSDTYKIVSIKNSKIEKRKISDTYKVDTTANSDDTVSFSSNGISIQATMENRVDRYGYVRIKAKMTNLNKTAVKGGLTISFPQISGIHGKYRNGNFSSTTAYDRGSKIYNKVFRNKMRADYSMVEGWQKSRWGYGKSRYFTVDIYPPSHLRELIVNLRGVLWIGSKYNTVESPKNSYIFDQQGYEVRQYRMKL